MTNVLNKSLVIQARSDGIENFTGVFLDPKALNVSATHPANRIPSTDLDAVKLLLRSFMATRSPGAIHDGDLYFVLDGAVSTLKNKLSGCFVDETGDPISKKEKGICLTIDKDFLITILHLEFLFPELMFSALSFRHSSLGWRGVVQAPIV